MGEQHDRGYVQRLGEVLRERNPAALRAFLEESARRFGDQRQVEAIRAKSQDEMQELMHRMILSRSDLAQLHAESRRWLQAGQMQQQPGPSHQPRDNHRDG